MSREILQPGIYHDISANDYHRDPCPRPSLTQSVAKILIDRSPLHAWHAHPKLNPDWHPDDPTKFDVGNVAHSLMLGRGKEIVILDEFDDWRTKAAKEARDKAAIEGKHAVLGKHFALADRMVRAAREQMADHPAAPLFEKGRGEVVLAWKDGDLWFRCMVDWLSDDLLLVDDYKTTAMSVAPHVVPAMMVSAGWDIQAAMIERGLTAIDGNAARKFRFVAQEDERPYALSVCELPETTLTMGRKKLQHAVDLWTWCHENNRWPCYPNDIVRPEYPGWAESQWLNREIAEAARARVPGGKAEMLTDLSGG